MPGATAIIPLYWWTDRNHEELKFRILIVTNEAEKQKRAAFSLKGGPCMLGSETAAIYDAAKHHQPLPAHLSSAWSGRFYKFTGSFGARLVANVHITATPLETR